MAKAAKGRKGAKGAKRGNGKKGRSRHEVKEVASLTEVQQVGTLTTNTNYAQYNLSLASLSRAQDVAKGYQFYRISRITYVIKPLMDTFVQTTGGGEATVPYLYYMIDRVKQFATGFTIAQLKAMGAKARRLDDKTLAFSFTPSVLTETFDNTPGANAAVQYKMSPWLPCKDGSQIGIWNPNTTDHLGVVWRVEQALGNAIGFYVERRVQVEFKKPAIPTSVGEPLLEPVEVETLFD